MAVAKPDKNGHLEKLSIEQLNACELLMTGTSDAEVAQKINRGRQTVCHWRLHSPQFRAELNRRRAEVWEAANDKLRSLIPKALAVIERELDDGDHCFKAALAIVKLASLPLNNIGAQEEEEILAEAAKEQERTMFATLTSPKTFRQEIIDRANEDDNDSEERNNSNERK